MVEPQSCRSDLVKLVLEHSNLLVLDQLLLALLLFTSFQFVDVTLDVSCVMLFVGRMIRVKNYSELTLYASMYCFSWIVNALSKL